MARLSATIASDHALPTGEIASYRGRRDPVWDAGLFLVAAAAFAAGVHRLVGRIRGTFDSTPTVAAVIVVAAIPVALLGVAAGEFLSLIAEGLRVSNMSHLSGFRGERIPWRHHRIELLCTGIVLFWLVAVATRSRAQTRTQS